MSQLQRRKRHSTWFYRTIVPVNPKSVKATPFRFTEV